MKCWGDWLFWKMTGSVNLAKSSCAVKWVRTKKKHFFSQYYENSKRGVCTEILKIALLDPSKSSLFDPILAHFWTRKNMKNDAKGLFGRQATKNHPLKMEAPRRHFLGQILVKKGSSKSRFRPCRMVHQKWTNIFADKTKPGHPKTQFFTPPFLSLFLAVFWTHLRGPY